ncbi:VOC family protein [Curtobacterium flaccumfaciens pv. flaccumfaciens]
MATVRQVQVTFDCAEPERVARFWCEVLGYVVPPPPTGVRRLGRVRPVAAAGAPGLGLRVRRPDRCRPPACSSSASPRARR